MGMTSVNVIFILAIPSPLEFSTVELKPAFCNHVTIRNGHKRNFLGNHEHSSLSSFALSLCRNVH